MKVAGLYRKYGISDAACYKWKTKFGSMPASGLMRMKKVEAEAFPAETTYADLALENRVMKNLIEKYSKTV